MEGINDLSSLLSIQNAIDITQIHIQKPKSHIFVTNYYYFKSKAYNMQLRAIIDHKKHFFMFSWGCKGQWMMWGFYTYP